MVVKKIVNLPRYYRYRYKKLINIGLLSFEAREVARQYTTAQIRHLPYLQSMIRTRKLYIIQFKNKGYEDKEIRDRIYALYDTKDWITEGRPDVWKMIRSFRDKSIDRNEYIPPRRKGSHHKEGISKGDLVGQKQRRRKKLSELEKYEIGRGR